MAIRYQTISSESYGLYKEKGSKFEAYSFPVENIHQIEQHLSELLKIHPKARHHCYAYVLGAEANEFRAFDAGEPKYSAGNPILGQIRSFEITNVLVVVVRYFGGTKLGIGGLINAYREAAKLSLESNKVTIKEPCQSFILTFAYPDMNNVMQLVKEMNLTILQQHLDQTCEMIVEIPIARSEVFLNRLEQQIEFEFKDF